MRLLAFNLSSTRVNARFYRLTMPTVCHRFLKNIFIEPIISSHQFVFRYEH